MQSNEFLYVLYFKKSNKYYVGKTNNIQYRYENHRNGDFCTYTKQYRDEICSIDEVERYSIECRNNETYLTIYIMYCHGIDNVCGGIFPIEGKRDSFYTNLKNIIEKIQVLGIKKDKKMTDTEFSNIMNNIKKLVEDERNSDINDRLECENSDTCYNCKKKGHYIKKCPEKKLKLKDNINYNKRDTNKMRELIDALRERMNQCEILEQKYKELSRENEKLKQSIKELENKITENEESNSVVSELLKTYNEQKRNEIVENINYILIENGKLLVEEKIANTKDEVKEENLLDDTTYKQYNFVSAVATNNTIKLTTNNNIRFNIENGQEPNTIKLICGVYFKINSDFTNKMGKCDKYIGDITKLIDLNKFNEFYNELSKISN